MGQAGRGGAGCGAGGGDTRERGGELGAGLRVCSGLSFLLLTSFSLSLWSFFLCLLVSLTGE